MLDVRPFGVFFSPQGRVAESGLRHSTRNRAWGNPPWVRIPPLPFPIVSSSEFAQLATRLATRPRMSCAGDFPRAGDSARSLKTLSKVIGRDVDIFSRF